MKMPYAIRVATPKGQPRPILQALSRRLALWVVLLALMGAHTAQAQKAIPPPTHQLVSDFANLLSAGQRAQLSNKLNAYARETSIQIAVVTEASLEGDEIFDYTVRLAQEWGIGGNDDKDNGILVYIARDERKMRIQTGYGAEGFLPDARAKRIVSDIMAPAFREGNYYAGIDQATTAIMDFGWGEYTAEEGGSAKEAKGFAVWLILGFIVVLVLLIIFFSRRNGKGGGHRRDDDSGYDRNGRYDMDRYARRNRQPTRQHHQPHTNSGGGGWFIFPFPGGGGGGGSWGGGGDSSGGDFGGFGGGDFGGGGAGGDW